MQDNNDSHYIWDKSVGVRIRRQSNNATAADFLTFELVRCYKPEGSDEFKYASTFTERNAEALGIVISKALNYIREHDLSEAA
jgi:hypothetical protein